MSRRYRNAVLELAGELRLRAAAGRFRPAVTPTPYVNSSLNTPDEEPFAGRMAPGTNCADAPILVDGKEGWLLSLLGDGFVVLVLGAAPTASRSRLGPRAGARAGGGPRLRRCEGPRRGALRRRARRRLSHPP